MTYTIDFTTTLKALNSNQRLHHHQRARLTRDWRQLGAELMRGQKIPALQRARIVATISFPDRRRRDAANWYPTIKALVDGMVADYGLLPDDDHTHLLGPDMRIGPVSGAGIRWRIDVYDLSTESDDTSEEA